MPEGRHGGRRGGAQAAWRWGRALGAVASRPWVLAATILASAMAFIDGSVVTIALPVLQRELAQASARCNGWSTATRCSWAR